MARKKNNLALFDIGFWTSKLVMDNLAFIFFLGFLAMVYIANAHYAERNVREIQTLRKELKEMRWYHRSLQSDNMYNAKRSEVAARVKEDGLRLQRKPPKRIVAHSKE